MGITSKYIKFSTVRLKSEMYSMITHVIKDLYMRRIEMF